MFTLFSGLDIPLQSNNLRILELREKRYLVVLPCCAILLLLRWVTVIVTITATAAEDIGASHPALFPSPGEEVARCLLIRALEILLRLKEAEEENMRPEEWKTLELLAEEAARRREEAKILRERLKSALEKLEIVINKAEGLKQLVNDLEAKPATGEEDASIVARRREELEQAQKERDEMYKMLEEITKEDLRREIIELQQKEEERQKDEAA